MQKQLNNLQFYVDDNLYNSIIQLRVLNGDSPNPSPLEYHANVVLGLELSFDTSLPAEGNYSGPSSRPILTLDSTFTRYPTLLAWSLNFFLRPFQAERRK